MIYPRTKNIFDPKSTKPFKFSRSKLENFVKCPRCFYLDRRLGIGQPSMPAFTLNSAVDHLLKKEFDTYREKKEPHPLMKANNIDAIPFDHPDLDKWRENFVGVQVHHKPTNFLVFGAIDDLWVKPDGELIVADYKATSKEGEITLDSDWQKSYKRQMEIYQWLLRENGFNVSDMSYFVYANGLKDRPGFHGKLEFNIQLIPYKADASWVEKVLTDAYECVSSDTIPPSAEACEYCDYRQASHKLE